MPDVVLRGMTGISSSTKGALLALGAFSLWAWSDVVVKYLSSSYQPLSILFYNGAFTLLMLLAASPWLGGLSLTLRSPHMKLHLLRGVVIFAQFLLLV